MSYSPFDGMVLDDPRPPIPGARAMHLHLQVDRSLARRQGRAPLGLEGLRDRSAACRELLAHGLFPETLRGLGLPLGSSRHLRSLANLAEHLEAYLAAVAATGHLEPSEALWSAVTARASGGRGLWIERTETDGPLVAGIEDLQPVRLRALAALEGAVAVTYRLATRKGDGSSGLFGGRLGLAEWFLEGLERYAEPFDLGLSHPEGWAEEAPWAPALEGLFEGPLRLDAAGQNALQRALVESPLDALRHAVEQVAAWVGSGLAPAEITLVHPAPASVAVLLAPLLANEGIGLHLRGELRPLLLSPAWAPLWALVDGLRQGDPCRVAAGLRASERTDLAAWSEELARADQTGLRGFQEALTPLPVPVRARAESTWQELQEVLALRTTASAWADRLGRLAYALRLPVASEAFFAPLNLLNEAWGREAWTFAEMHEALQVFLETATDPDTPRDAEGVRLLSPEALLTEWRGCRAALLLDLSEGAWPAQPKANPDLDWTRKAAVNAALLRLSATGEAAAFPPALQRFWLPQSEHGETLPRAFQREAYAFNTLLALTRERLVALSPRQDAQGNPLNQGPFWNALEGAGAWAPAADRAASRLRFAWEVPGTDALRLGRAASMQVRSPLESMAVAAPLPDRLPGLEAAWLKERPTASATPLEQLARCPFRSLAERVWGLSSLDPKSRFAMARGTLVHALLERLLRPLVGLPDWPAAFRRLYGLEPGLEDASLLAHLRQLWADRQETWWAELCPELPAEQRPRLAAEVGALLPNLTQYLVGDLEATGPTKFELCLLYPEQAPIDHWRTSKKRDLPLQSDWRRELLDLEIELGPLELDWGAGPAFAVSGKADRVERWSHPEAGTFLRVVDYKTSGSAYLRAFAEEEAPFGTHLQLPLYALLAEQRFGAPATALLVPLKEETPRPWDRQLAVLAQSEAEGRPWRTRLKAGLRGLAERLGRGDFPATPGDHCTHCQLAALCGRPVDLQAESEEGDAE